MIRELGTWILVTLKLVADKVCPVGYKYYQVAGVGMVDRQLYCRRGIQSTLLWKHCMVAW